MRRWLLALMIVAAVASGVSAGMPLHTDDHSMPKCCDKAKSGEHSNEAEATRLCCLLDCSSPAPAQTGLQFNFSPATVAVIDLTRAYYSEFDLRANYAFETSVFDRTARDIPDFPPKFLQHSSFLI
ncbi:MAG: hypothetical protein IT172_02200 [Acidobacteria bacterium]|nr:hypothetical protein [Acidobacteriota bacterium]